MAWTLFSHSSLVIPCKWESGADPGIFDRGGGPNFRSEGTVGLFWGKLLLPHTPPHPLPPVTVAHYNSLATYCRTTTTRKGCTLGTSSSCVWLQRLYRFRQHQCQGHDVSAWVQVLTIAYRTSCLWDMTWFIATQRINTQLWQN